MCVDPVTAISVGSSALGAVSSLAGGFANNRAAGIAADVARNNAQMALDEGAGRAAQIDLRVNNAIGRTRAAAGAGNIEIGSGSALAAEVFSAQQGNTDKQLTMAGALNQSAGQHFAAYQDYEKAAQDRIAAFVGAGTAVLGGLAGMRGLGGNLNGAGGFKVAPGFMTGEYGF